MQVMRRTNYWTNKTKVRNPQKAQQVTWVCQNWGISTIFEHWNSIVH
jgi:hypothetical protein